MLKAITPEACFNSTIGTINRIYQKVKTVLPQSFNSTIGTINRALIIACSTRKDVSIPQSVQLTGSVEKYREAGINVSIPQSVQLTESGQRSHIREQ